MSYFNDDDDELTYDEQEDVEEFERISLEQEEELSDENITSKIQRDLLTRLGSFLIQFRNYTVEEAKTLINKVGKKFNYFWFAIEEALDDITESWFGEI